MFGNLSGPTLLVILFIVLLLFGAPKLPGLAKSLGQSMRILKKEVRTNDEDSSASTNTSGAAGTAASQEPTGQSDTTSSTNTSNSQEPDKPQP